MDQIGIFAKYWEPGAVKTRLAATIGAVEASCIYQALLLVILDRTHGLGDRHVLAYWPEHRRAEFENVARNQWTLSPQSTGSLGTRMQQYFVDALAHGARRVVLLGSDSPTLPIEFIERAWASLDDHPVVLGPTQDGGYYLIGIRDEVPPVFDQIAWSTPQVWDQTVSRLHQSQIPFAELPGWYDVDCLHDLLRLRDELARPIECDGTWDRLRAVVHSALERGGRMTNDE